MSAANSGNGLTISQLSIPITPKFSNSKLVMQWVVNGEVFHDTIFVVHRAGALITTTGEAGYNIEAGNTRWSGFTPAAYDQNQDSTPSTYTIQYFATSGSTATTSFAPAIKASGPGTQTFSMNRTLGSAGQDNYEAMVSTGIIWEIAQ
jgi:hypothetical protein